MVESKKKKQCFVVSPIGKAGSEARIHADWLLEGIIRPVFAASYPEYDIVRADTISAPGLIDTQIIEPLLDAELVIADITTLNPNVFYEIGIRHVVGKPIVHMHLDGETIPFDISIFRSIPFSRVAYHDIEKAKADLTKALQAVLAPGYKVDNPVTRTRTKIDIDASSLPVDKLVQAQLEDISARLAAVESPRNSSSALEKARLGKGLTTLIREMEPKLALEIGVVDAAHLRDLKDFLSRLADMPEGARVVENNGNNFVYEFPDTSHNRNLIDYMTKLAAADNGSVYVKAWVPK